MSEKKIRIFYTFEKIPRDQKIVKRQWNGIFKYLLNEVVSFKDGAQLVKTLQSWTGATLNSVGAESGQWVMHGLNVILGLSALGFGVGNPNNGNDNGNVNGNSNALPLQPLNPQNIGLVQIQIFQQLAQLVAHAQQIGPNAPAAIQAILGLQAQIQELAFQLQQQQQQQQPAANGGNNGVN